MKYSLARVTIEGLAPLSQSRQHTAPKLEGEKLDDYDLRTWRDKLNVSPRTKTIVIPQHGMHQALMAACKYSSKQIPGQGKKTWTAKFTTGIMIAEEIDTGISPDKAEMISLSVSANGMRGAGKRVTRHFPMLYEWSAKMEVMILDPIITEPIFTEMLTIAGMSIGVGRFRPEVGGHNGRFKIASIDWQDNRQLMSA